MRCDAQPTGGGGHPSRMTPSDIDDCRSLLTPTRLLPRRSLRGVSVGPLARARGGGCLASHGPGHAPCRPSSVHLCAPARTAPVSAGIRIRAGIRRRPGVPFPLSRVRCRNKQAPPKGTLRRARAKRRADDDDDDGARPTQNTRSTLAHSIPSCLAPPSVEPRPERGCRERLHRRHPRLPPSDPRAACRLPRHRFPTRKTGIGASTGCA